MAKRQCSRRSRKQLRGGRKTARRTISGRRRIMQTGGQPINLKNILITPSIIEAVKQYRPGFDPKAEGFKLLAKEKQAGFKLSRMDRMMTANINALVQTEPVELIESARHPTLGILYDIVNGRHRVSRAIIDNLPTINATIVQLP